MDQSRIDELLLSLLRRNPDGIGITGEAELSSVDWDDLLCKSAQHNVTPLLYHRLTTFHPGTPIPANVMERLRQAYLQCSGRNMRLYHELGKLLGILRRLGETRAPIIVVRPVVGGRSPKGPTDKFLRWAKVEVSPLGVARFYQSIPGGVQGMLIDHADEKQAAAIEALGIRVKVGDIIMRDAEAKRRVARLALSLREAL